MESSMSPKWASKVLMDRPVSMAAQRAGLVVLWFMGFPLFGFCGSSDGESLEKTRSTNGG